MCVTEFLYTQIWKKASKKWKFIITKQPKNYQHITKK